VLEKRGRHSTCVTTHELNALNSRLRDAAADSMMLTVQVRGATPKAASDEGIITASSCDEKVLHAGPALGVLCLFPGVLLCVACQLALLVRVSAVCLVSCTSSSGQHE
jgi:hypothetical protein